MRKKVNIMFFGLVLLLFNACSTNMTLLKQSQFQHDKDLSFLRSKSPKSLENIVISQEDKKIESPTSKPTKTHEKIPSLTSIFNELIIINDTIKPDTLKQDSAQIVLVDTIPQEGEEEWEYVTPHSKKQIKKIETLGLISFISNLLGLLLLYYVPIIPILLFIAGLVLAIISLSKYKRNPEKYKFIFFPIATIVLTITEVIIALFFLFILFLLLLGFI